MSGLERIRCRRCGANSFPGSQACWNCGASLPPPEETSISDVVEPGQPVPQRISPQVGTHRNAVIVIVVAAVLLAAMYLFVHRIAQSGVEARQAQLRALQQRLMRERLGGAGRIPMAPTTDPTEAQARRELERLQRQLDTMPMPGPGSDARLRTEGQR